VSGHGIVRRRALMRYTYRGLALLALACLLYLEAYVFENLVPVFVGFGILLYIAYARLEFSSQLKAQDLEADREILEDMMFAGKPFTVLTRLRNKGGPARLTIQDELPEGLAVRSGVNAATVELNQGEVAKLKYTVSGEKRGHYRFPRITVTTHARPGLFVHESVMELPTEARVHASRDELRKAQTIAKREHMEILGRSPERWTRTREFHFEGIREYVPGDRFRDIHWKSVSRLLKLMTKIYEREAMVPTTILLDCGKSMRVARGGRTKLDHGTGIAIQMSRVLLSGYHPTGLVAFDELGTLERVPSDVARSQFDSILKALLRVPGEIRTEQETQRQLPAQQPRPSHASDSQFVSLVSRYISDKKRAGASPKIGLEEVVRTSVAKGGKGQMFMIISDLESNHDAVVRSATFARSQGHRAIVISPFSELYGMDRRELTAEGLEALYDPYVARLRTLTRLHRLGVLVVELGPKDEAASVTRQLRKAMT